MSAGKPHERPSPVIRLLTSGGFLAALVVFGAALRALQYFSRSSLWVDEAALALNIAARPFSALFGPLNWAQIAPWGFLAIEKGLFGLFGRNELGLRLLPFLSSLLSLVFFERLCRRVLGRFAVPFALGSFTLATELILYAAELKQYAVDVAVAVGVVLLAIVFEENGLTPRRALVLGGVGMLAGAFSQGVVFVLAGVGLSLVLLALARRTTATPGALALLGVLWGTGAGFAFWSAERLLTPDLRSYMQDFWLSGFMPFPPKTRSDFSWLWRQMTGIVGGFLRYPMPSLFMALLLVGIVGLGRRKPLVALFFLVPLLLTVGASAARLYPFAPGRLTAFLVPGLLVFIAEGVERVRTLPFRRLAWVGAAAATIATAGPVWAIAGNPPPYLHEHVRPALEQLRETWRPGDVLYVYYGVRLPYLFYAPLLDLEAKEHVLGECARDNPRSYLRQLDALRGRPRVWVLLAHDLPRFDEGRLIFDYLDQIGRPLQREDFRFHGSPFAVVLAAYDLGEPDRLSATTAERFPVPERPRGFLMGLTCEGTMGPVPPSVGTR